MSSKRVAKNVLEVPKSGPVVFQASRAPASGKSSAKEQINKLEAHDEWREGEPVQSERVVLVEVDQMHQSDVMTLARRVTAANTRISAECTELRAAQYPFEPATMLARYDALQRMLDAARGLLMRVACVALACLVLAGCAGDGGGSYAPSSSAPSACANGQCRLNQ